MVRNLSGRNKIILVWKDDSAVKSAIDFFRGCRFDSQYQHGGSQLGATPGLGLKPSSGLRGHSTHVV